MNSHACISLYERKLGHFGMLWKSVSCHALTQGDPCHDVNKVGSKLRVGRGTRAPESTFQARPPRHPACDVAPRQVDSFTNGVIDISQCAPSDPLQPKTWPPCPSRNTIPCDEVTTPTPSNHMLTKSLAHSLSKRIRYSPTVTNSLATQWPLVHSRPTSTPPSIHTYM